ncbi:hypothetical protein, partial [Legionella sp.]|uniref:hypothetical protein n=1 Tax=Legionella sp. TaxID=459 RepID=UPI003C887266
KNFETTLNQFFSLPLSADFFEKVTELSIVYDEQSLPIPEEIAANLMKYLTGLNKAYNMHTEFTCHQFAFLLTTGKQLPSMNREAHITTAPHLNPGQIIQFMKQKNDFGARDLGVEFTHSALYLGNGLFFSKNGSSYPGIFTLDALLEVYPCDYITAVTEATPGGNNSLNIKSSMHLSFKNKEYKQDGLAYRALGARSTSLRQLHPKALNTFYRHAALIFHPDKTKLPVEQARVFLHLSKTIHTFLTDPIKRSEYNVSLLAGEDWSIAQILDLSFDSLDSATVVANYENFIALLKHYDNLKPDEEQKLNNDPRYKQALSRVDGAPNNDIIVHISNDVSHLVNHDPHHPTSISFEGKTKYLNDTLHYTISPDTRIGDLKIYAGTPVIIPFNTDTLNEQSMKSEEFLGQLPPDLFTYFDVKNAIELLDVWILRDGKPISLNSDHSEKKHLTQRPNNLVFFIGNPSRVCNVGVSLGGNYYLFKRNSRSNEAFIANVAYLQTDFNLGQVVSLKDFNMCTPSYRKKLVNVQSLQFTEAESFPRLSYDQAEAFKRYVLTFLTSRNYQFVAYINGLKLDKTKPIRYNVTPNMSQYILQQGQGVLLCKGTRIVCEVLHLGNNLFVLPSTTGYLRISNLLMLSELADWDSMMVMQPIQPQEFNGSPSCNIIQFRKKVSLGEIKHPLLYALLGIPFDLTNLSAITEEVVVECYKKRAQNETDLEVIKVLNLAYKLLMNDSYRVFYGSEILFGNERALSLEILFDINHSTSASESVKTYLSCLRLISNKELKDHISERSFFVSATKKLTTDFIKSLPLDSNRSVTYGRGRSRWWSFFNSNGRAPSPEEIFTQYPEAKETFNKLEQQFELREIKINNLSEEIIDRLFECIWQTIKPQVPQASQTPNDDVTSLSHVVSSSPKKTATTSGRFFNTNTRPRELETDIQNTLERLLHPNISFPFGTHDNNEELRKKI